MAIFSKHDYIWLASFFRDEIYRAKLEDDKDHSENKIRQNFTKELIKNLSTDLKSDNQMFDEKRFYDSIYFHPTRPERAGGVKELKQSCKI